MQSPDAAVWQRVQRGIFQLCFKLLYTGSESSLPLPACHFPDGMVAELVEWLRSRHPAQQKVATLSVLVALWLSNARQRQALASLGLIVPLVQLLKGESKQNIKQAASAIWDLTMIDERVQSAVAAAGAAPRLAELVESSDRLIRMSAGAALHRLR